MKRGIFSTLLLATAAACSTAAAGAKPIHASNVEAPAHEATPVETPVVEGTAPPQSGSPSATLEALRIAVEGCDEAGLRAVIWDLPLGDDRTADQAVRSIWSGRTGGDWGLSDRALEALIDGGDERFQVPKEGQPLEFAQELAAADPTLAQIARDDPEAFVMLWNDRAVLAMVRHQGTYRLLFWEDLDELAGTTPPPGDRRPRCPHSD